MTDIVTMTVRGLLEAAHWRSAAELERMSSEDQRNTLIVELAGHTNQSGGYFQGLGNEALVGRGAVVVFLLRAGSHDRAALACMSDAEQRQAVIDAVNRHAAVTDMPLTELQAMDSRQLVALGLELMAAPVVDTRPALGDGSFRRPLLIDPVRKLPDPDDRGYVQIAAHANPGVELQFNTVENRSTRSVTMSGVRLVFDRGDDYLKQMAYQGKDVLDLKSLDLRADQIIIRVPLRFPGTDVRIHARELIFEDSGDEFACIDTTPLPFVQAALCPTRSKEGNHPADSSGKPTFIAADGRHGEKAGDVHLYVRRIRCQGNGRKRFICNGSPGQAGEMGGLKPYEPKSADQPGADKGKNLRPVQIKDIRDHLGNLSGVEEKSEGRWRWPDGGFGAGSLEGVSGQDFALKNDKVVHLRLILHNCNSYIARARRTFFPSLDTMRTLGCEFLVPAGAFPNPARIGCVEGELAKYKTHVDGSRQRPGDGEDAYAGGRPGNGGQGGSVISWIAGMPADPALCEVGGGACGPETPAVAGGAPGTPLPAYWGEMYAIQRDGVIEAPLNPTFTLTRVDAKPGAGAAAKKGVDGGRGAVETRAGPPRGWLHPQAVQAVVAYAQDAYRNGHRTTARQMIGPYYHALAFSGEPLGPELSGKLNEIVAMRSNLDNNLDFYGNPAGWVPRLDLKSNYQIWHWFSIQSSRVLYFASKLEHHWDRLDDKSQAISQTSRAVKNEMVAVSAALGTAYADLKAAKKDLDRLQEQFQARQADVDALRLKAAALARTKIEEQRIFSGMMKLVGGLAEIIPLGQPFLGLAGKSLATVGDHDWTQPDSSKQLASLFTKLGKQAGDFLENNEDLLVSLSGSSVPRPAGSADDLKAQIKQAQAAVEAIEGKADKLSAAVENEWTDVLVGERERLVSEIDLARKAMLDLQKNGNAAQAKAKGEELTAFEAELAWKAGLRMDRARKKLEDQLQSLNKSVKDSARAKMLHEQELLDKVKALELRKADFANQLENYAEDKKAAEKKTKNLLSSLSGLGDGISRVGQGIVAMCAPYDEQEVDRQAEKILAGSELKAEYLKLLADVKDLNARKSSAAGVFCLQQKLVVNYSARLSTAMLELNALTSQRQVADGVLDPGMKTYLRGMQERARAHLLWAQYHFVKAWQYEYLADVGDDFYNLEHWVSRFLEFEKLRSGIANTKKKLDELDEKDQDKVINTFLTEDDFAQIGESVRQEQSLSLVRNLLNQRQHHPGRQRERFDLTLSEAQLACLARDGKVSFSLVDDFQVVSLKDVHATIADVNLEVFLIDSQDQKLNVRIEFVHAGTSILLKEDRKYFKFQKAPAEQPIVWRFAYSHGVYLRLVKDEEEVWTYFSKKIINKNEDVEDAANALLKEEFGESLSLKYTEYMPSAFSQLTLWLNRGQFADAGQYQAFLQRIGGISKVQFAVDIVHQGTSD
ncbi:hypothetical protein [Azohydromonas aeria]|uniref:hypothetical protein n=1 Tax=Azohydromonas aeria TaxID=2590212 RepID=UPI0012FAF801|nr:hypothetical protein [Azohydromonas aeria]